MPSMNETTLRSWIIMDSIFSQAFYGALHQALEQGGYTDEVRGFLEVVDVPPWILESIVNTAIVRWCHLLGTPGGQEIASFLARCYLDSGDFFGDDVAGPIRAEFSRIVVEAAALLIKQPHPAGSPWN